MTVRVARYVDNCPECVARVPCEPLTAERIHTLCTDSVHATYRCPACAHTWACAWQYEPEES